MFEWPKLEDFSYMWEEDKDSYVLFRTTGVLGRDILGIANIDEDYIPWIEDDELLQALVDKMLSAHVRIVDDLQEAVRKHKSDGQANSNESA